MALDPIPEYNDGPIWDRAWSQVSTTIDGDDPFMEINRIKFRKLGTLLPRPPSRTLEVGSGSGRMSTWLARSGYSASCLDRSIPALRAARSNFEKIERPGAATVADGSRAPYRTGTFDVVLSTGLLEHFVDPQPILDEMVRVLKPGGLFYSDIVPDKFSLFRALRFPRLKALLGRPEPFERPMSRDEILTYLGKTGLTHIEVIPMGVFPPVVPGVLRLKPALRAYQALTALPVWELFDGASWSEPLALYYFCTGINRSGDRRTTMEIDRNLARVARVARHAADLAKRTVYAAGGNMPRGRGYGAHRAKSVADAIKDPDRFDPRRLPAGWGARIDERIVEYPWLFARLPPGPGRLLDAGSILNFEFLVEHPRIAEKRVFISNLQPERHCYYDRGISYVFEDLRECCYRDGYFDWVVSISTLEHVGMDNTQFYSGGLSRNENRDDAYCAVVQELRRVLRPGGRLFLTVPFGRKADHGWFQVFDASMVDRVIEAFAPSEVQEHHFRYLEEGWVASDREGSKSCTYSDFYRTGTYDADLAVGARAVVCLDLVKETGATGS